MKFVGPAVFAILIFIAITAPLIYPGDPLNVDLPSRLAPPSFAHPLGQDQNGSDVLGQIIWGARTSIGISLAVAMISVFFGLVVGTVAGWRGGWIDIALSRAIDMIQAFPGFLLALALVAMLGPSVPNLILALVITGWTGYARLVRGEVQRLKSLDYVLAAESAGSTALRICAKHIWPNLWSILIVQATFGLAGIILVESALSFLGLGVPATTASWGALLNNGRRFLSEAPHISLFPGLVVFLLVASIQLTGESLRSRWNPRERN